MYAVRFFVNVFRIHLCWPFRTPLVISTQRLSRIYTVWNHISAAKGSSGAVRSGPILLPKKHCFVLGVARKHTLFNTPAQHPVRRVTFKLEMVLLWNGFSLIEIISQAVSGSTVDISEAHIFLNLSYFVRFHSDLVSNLLTCHHLLAISWQKKIIGVEPAL